MLRRSWASTSASPLDVVDAWAATPAVTGSRSVEAPSSGADIARVVRYDPGVRYSTGVWFSGLLVAVALGVIFGVQHRPDGHLPRHAGYYIAAVLFVGGLTVGWQAAWWGVAASVAFGIARYLATLHGEHDQRVLLILYFTYFPFVLAVPALVGGAIRAAVRWRSRQSLAKHAD
jgi:hypothetical protein